MNKFLATGLGQFIKGAVMGGIGAVVILIQTGSGLNWKYLAGAFVTGVLEYLHNLMPK